MVLIIFAGLATPLLLIFWTWIFGLSLKGPAPWSTAGTMQMRTAFASKSLPRLLVGPFRSSRQHCFPGRVMRPFRLYNLLPDTPVRQALCIGLFAHSTAVVNEGFTWLCHRGCLPHEGLLHTANTL